MRGQRKGNKNTYNDNVFGTQSLEHFDLIFEISKLEIDISKSIFGVLKVMK